MKYNLICGNSLEELKKLADNSVDSIVTDPPYELGFMGKSWDSTGIAYNKDLWKECLRVLKPGGHMVAFSGSRTIHRMVCAIEDVGFEIRDQILWIYGSGFPKSLDVSKAIDKKFGEEVKTTYEPNYKNNDYGKGLGGGKTDTTWKPSTEQAKLWQGWGTALKPAHEPICFARKPLSEKTIAENVLKWGVGAINIEESRVGNEIMKSQPSGKTSRAFQSEETTTAGGLCNESIGRFPANVIHDGLSEEWSRYFYCAKASKKDRNDGCDGLPLKSGGSNAKGYTEDVAKGIDRNKPVANHHPTVKPVDLMKYLVRLITPKGGTVLDPFNGSGSTGKACAILDFDYIGIDLSQEYLDISKARIENELNNLTK